MDLQLQNMRALVTGSSSGIGEAIAEALALAGASIVVHGRDSFRTENVADRIRRQGGVAKCVLGHLNSDTSAESVSSAALDAFGGIDILVNNAGTFPEKPWFETSSDEWVELYNQNVASMVRLVAMLVPAMRLQGWGRVITIGSVVGTMPSPTFSAYSATKSAAVNMAVNLAKELGGSGVTSNAVSPGDIITPGSEGRWRAIASRKGYIGDWEAIQKRIPEWAPTPSGKAGVAENVADVVAFLASPRSALINGTNIHVDGGAIPTLC